MMGERDSQKQLRSYQVNLDKRVRSDHPLRRIDQARDLDFVRPEVARFYSTKGKTGSEAASPDHSSFCRATPLSFSRARYSSTRSKLPSPAR
jgi:hypothetical protein